MRRNQHCRLGVRSLLLHFLPFLSNDPKKKVCSFIRLFTGDKNFYTFTQVIGMTTKISEGKSALSARSVKFVAAFFTFSF